MAWIFALADLLPFLLRSRVTWSRYRCRQEEDMPADALAFMQVVWLDVAAARSRYGRWVDGALPEFVPFPRTTRARTKRQAEADAGAAAAAAAAALQDPDAALLIRLRRLR